MHLLSIILFLMIVVYLERGNVLPWSCGSHGCSQVTGIQCEDEEPAQAVAHPGQLERDWIPSDVGRVPAQVGGQDGSRGAQQVLQVEPDGTPDQVAGKRSCKDDDAGHDPGLGREDVEEGVHVDSGALVLVHVECKTEFKKSIFSTQ